jgi:hypothetical protein
VFAETRTAEDEEIAAGDVAVVAVEVDVGVVVADEGFELLPDEHAAASRITAKDMPTERRGRMEISGARGLGSCEPSPTTLRRS